MVSYFNSLNFLECSNIVIFGKNSVYWIFVDFVIWVVGYILVLLYFMLNGDIVVYVLEYSEVKLMFLGKLDGMVDGWNDIKDCIFEDLLFILLFLLFWDDILKWLELVVQNQFLEFKLLDLDVLVILIYIFGSIG